MLFIELTALGIVVFLFTTVVFLLAVKFYIDSKKNLQQFMPEENPSRLRFFVTPQTPASTPKQQKNTPKEKQQSRPAKRELAAEPAPGDLRKMKEMLIEQQKELTKALAQLQQVEVGKSPKASEDLEKEIDDLNYVIDKKDAEIKSLRQQTDITKEMQSHFDELEDEVAFLQEKLSKLEEQAWQANELALKVENMQQTQQHLEKELLRKEDKLLELTAENQRLNTLLNTTEDKLQAANMQRQQLQKKVQFLEEMNNDMKQMSDTNRKLQTEIRRIAELESMLNLMMEERDELLRQRYK